MSSGPPNNDPLSGNASPEPNNHRTRRRERRAAAKRSGQLEDGPPLASGSSTILRTADEHGKQNEQNGDTNGASGSRAAITTLDDPATFGDEFIPFVLDDDEDTTASKKDSNQNSGAADEGFDINREERSKGEKGKEREHHREQEDTRSSRRSQTTKEASDAYKDSERERDRGNRRLDDDDDRRGGRSDRDGGRGNDRNHKRKRDEYDREDGYENKKQRIDASSRKCPWVAGLDLEKCQNVAEMMHCEVESFVKWISPSSVEDEVRGLIVAHITKVVKKSFPDAEVHPFGSYQTKLYLPLGDIDLVVLSDSMAYSDKATVLRVMANTLKRSGITTHVTIIAKAKVPIVKFVTSHGRFKVDISINQANGLVSGKIISGFLRDMTPCEEGAESKALRSLVMITKAFLSQRSMNEVYTGGLGSYSIVCMAVSFLQMHPKIRRGEIDPEKNLGVLVMEFFELYGIYFNYDEVGISLREGGTYFSKRQRGWHAEYKRNMLSIEDPADPSNDISSGSYNFHKVKTAFAGAHGILTSTAYLRAGMLSSRHHGRSVSLRGHYESEDLSILSTVMGITQETVNHRKLVQELYDKRVLHNIVGVKPKHDAVNGYSNSTTSSKPDILESGKNGREFSDESEDEDNLPSRRHQRSMKDEERGRYDIGRQPPKKRRKTGKPEDAHAIYFVDDEESRSDRYDAYEDGEYLSDESLPNEHPASRSTTNPRSDNRRSYWLSKGIGIEGTFDEGG